MDNLTCDNCAHKLCCYQHVQLTNRDLKRFIKAKLFPKLLVTNVGPLKFVFLHSPYSPAKCVYLKDGRCTIYNDRPNVCRKFECKAHGEPIDNLYVMDENRDYKEYINVLTSSKLDASDMLPLERLDEKLLRKFSTVLVKDPIKEFQSNYAKLYVAIGGNIEDLK